MKKLVFILISLPLISLSQSSLKKKELTKKTLIYPQEVHFKNMRQLTFEGENAEAYWSFDDSQLIFQATNENWGQSCDQIYIIDTNNYNYNNVIINKSPDFLDNNGSDFHLTQGSPAIDAGIGPSDNDIEGNPRENPDLGAFEFQD